MLITAKIQSLGSIDQSFRLNDFPFAKDFNLDKYQ